METTLLAATLSIGDVIFIRVGVRLFREVATATGSWTNHVGIVVENANGRVAIAESTFPFSSITTLDRFLARSEGGRVAVARLNRTLTAGEETRLINAARGRVGIWYDTGFDLHSRRQFCSRFVHEVLAEATGLAVGEAQRFDELLAQQPAAALGFWRLWYLGRIPWQRQTITPASVLGSPHLDILFDGTVSASN
ncbi:YebB family permuted papain-like enzyme [Caballeronia sp. BR00000012568055]|uniref:YebB family permuted papain-like enzyme n=1 Tax=Caballeronia sp. BR00000012568055 TaxID=2918761 RepID=UPI0023F64745|nr:YebB family permuted papain-like enzyme [Caballeronia sp. BR00000012568055]